jgi:hypothetical protein
VLRGSESRQELGPPVPAHGRALRRRHAPQRGRHQRPAPRPTAPCEAWGTKGQGPEAPRLVHGDRLAPLRHGDPATPRPSPIEASVHRSLSKISPLFSDPYSELLLLGGALNTSTQWPKGRHLDGDTAVLGRIEACGLVDCLGLKRPPRRLPDCPCVLEECTHTWTRLDSSRPALQVDKLFVSPALAEPERLRSCEALPSPEWQEFSNHAPIDATFDH